MQLLPLIEGAGMMLLSGMVRPAIGRPAGSVPTIGALLVSYPVTGSKQPRPRPARRRCAAKIVRKVVEGLMPVVMSAGTDSAAGR